MNRSSVTVHKTIYFDKETVQNMLQEFNRGKKTRTTDVSSSMHGEIEAGISNETKLDLKVPFFARLGFLLTSKLSASYALVLNKNVTISSTEISEFEELKPHLTAIKDETLKDIVNSSTSIRLAGGYMRMLKDDIDGLKVAELKGVMDSYDGYDIYQLEKTEGVYVRFNNTAFLSNYKRNDLVNTKMDLYCVYVGTFSEDRFDFQKELSKMGALLSADNQPQYIADIYPPSQVQDETSGTQTSSISHKETQDSHGEIKLYDVVCARVVIRKTKDE